MENPTILVLSQPRFDSFCKEHNFTDESLNNDKELVSKYAFISIIGTPDCLKYYLNESDTEHWFKENHDNVINLEFDDLDFDIDFEGHLFKAMNEEQAKKLFEFIENNIGKTFIIHCRAGKSRSAAVGQFIKDFYHDVYGKLDLHWPTPNHCVYRLLSRQYYRKYKIFENNE